MTDRLVLKEREEKGEREEEERGKKKREEKKGRKGGKGEEKEEQERKKRKGFKPGVILFCFNQRLHVSSVGIRVPCDQRLFPFFFFF